MKMNYIGVDLGGTNIVVGLVDEDGKIVKSISRPTVKERGVEPIFDDIFDMCNELINEFKLDKTSLKGIGIGIPGTIDDKRQRSLFLCPDRSEDSFSAPRVSESGCSAQ